MYQVIISWIAGALLPIVALGMTALVAQNMTFMKEENDDNESSKAGERESEKIYDETTAPYRGPSQKPNDQVDDLKKEEYVATEIPDRENQLESLKNALFNNTFHEASYKEENSPKDKESGMTIIEKPVQINIQSEEDANKEFAELIEREEQEEKTAAASIIPSEKEIEEIIENEVQKRMAEIPMESIVQKYNDLQKNINSYKAESEMNPRTEMSEIIDDGGISDELDEEIERLSTIIYPNKMEEYIHTSPILQPDASDFKDFSDYVNDQIMNDLKEGKHLSKEAERLTEKVSQPIGKYDMKFGPEFTKMMAEINEEESKKEVIVEPPKKRGRPPKQKDKVAETKKEREPLPKEEVKVPQKPKRRVNPLKRKAKKIKPLKSLKEINKPSKGDEVIALLEKMEREEKKESITPLAKNEQESQESLLVPPELKDNFASYVVNGVEVIDAKAVPVKKNLN